MQNDDGEIVDVYIPRKCSATNTLITAKDHASTQINIAKVNANGCYSGDYETIAFCGMIRSQGESDENLIRLAKEKGVY